MAIVNTSVDQSVIQDVCELDDIGISIVHETTDTIPNQCSFCQKLGENIINPITIIPVYNL